MKSIDSRYLYYIVYVRQLSISSRSDESPNAASASGEG